mmetsp:Transcript_52566/g.114800  ORF Transcript_52566/g.114800 Transcript_52566/m.114800 type:complete len:90 (-) Transcript_52566:18-287(-)
MAYEEDNAGREWSSTEAEEDVWGSEDPAPGPGTAASSLASELSARGLPPSFLPAWEDSAEAATDADGSRGTAGTAATAGLKLTKLGRGI